MTGDSRMKRHITIEGAGGGKGGGGRTPQEAPNTLQSRSHISIVELLSEGEIEGIVGGLRGVFLDNTPVENSNGTFNFQGVDFDQRPGTDVQTPVPSFTNSETIVPVNTELEDQTGVVRTLSSFAPDRARVVVRLPNGLSRLDSETGDLVGYSVGIAIDTRLDQFQPWTQVFTKVITGKTTRAYEEAYLVDKPQGPFTSNPWEIRVRRTTVPADSAQVSDRVDWTLLGEIFMETVRYDWAALAAIRFDSQATGGTIPVRSYLIDGIRCRVPVNYQPTQYNAAGEITANPTFTDPGNWAGNFKTERCNDPAWICYDILTNERYGLGEWVGIQDIDIYSFYEASLYNTELVEGDPDYPGGEMPRFVFDGVVSLQEDAFTTLQAIAASCRGVIVSNGGLIRFVQDRPADPVALINNTRVVGGDFSYSSTDFNSRFTSINAVFNDRRGRYLPRITTERTDNPNFLNRYGFNETELELMGCTHERQARRQARWALFTGLLETDTVEFQVSYEDSFLDVYDIIRIEDEHAYEFGQGGLVTAAQTTSDPFGGPTRALWTLDEFEQQGSLFNLYISTADGGQETLAVITSDAANNQVMTSMPSGPLSDYVGAPWSTGAESQVRLWRITSIEESDEGVYTVTAQLHDPFKFAVSDLLASIPTPVVPDLGGYNIARPGGVTIDVESVITPSSTLRFRVRVNWNPVNDPNLSHYRIKWRRNSNQYNLSSEITQNEFIIDDALPGLYEFELWAVSTRGVQSGITTAFQLVTLDGQASPLGPVSNLELVGGGFEFDEAQFTITWDGPPAASNAVPKDFVVNVYDSNDNIAKQFIAPIDEGSEDPITGRQAITNADILVANSTFVPRANRVGVQTRDNLNRLTSEVDATFTNPAPAAVEITDLEAQIGSYKVTHTGSTQDDQAGYKVIHSTTSPVPLSRASLQKDDQGLQHIVEADENTTYFVRVAAYDTWSSHIPELNWSDTESVTTDFEIVPIFTPPDDVLGVTIGGRIIYLAGGTPRAEILITWNTIPGDDVVYDLEISEAGDLYHQTVIPNPVAGGSVSYSINGIVGLEYCARVRSRRATVTSAWTSPVCHTQAADATAPALPTGLNLTPLYQGALAQWTNPTSENFAATQVWRRVGGSGTGELVATVSRPSAFLFDDGLVIGTQYQYRIRSVSVEGVFSNYSSWLPVTPSNVPAGSIVAASIAANTITSNQIAANTITANELSTGTLITSSAQIGNAVIASANIQDTLQSDNFQAGVSGWRLTRNTGALEANSITARGNLQVGSNVTGQYRTEISDTDPTYLIWTGTNAKTDANGIFWVKRNGDAFISQSDFGITTFPTFDTPPVPTGLSATGVSRVLTGGTEVADITATWSNVPGSFPGITYDLQIIRGTGSDVITTVTVPPAVSGNPRFTYRGEIGQTYSFRVRATNVNSRSAWSGTVTTTVNANTGAAGVPGTPTVTALPAFGAMVSWTNPGSNLLGRVEIQRRRSNGTDVATLGQVAAPTNIFSDGGPLTAGLGYQYRVRSISINGTFSAYSAWSGTFIAVTVPNGSIGSNQIVNNAITNTKIANNSISTPKLQANSITSNEIAANTITAGNILAGSITGDRLTANTITSNQLSTGTLITTSAQIGNGVINTANIGDAQITNAKIGGTLQSDTFTSTQGWQLTQGGSLFANNVDLRGSVVTGRSTGQRVEITPSGSDNFLIWAGVGSKNQANAQFWLDNSGNAAFAGTVRAANLSGPLLDTIPIIFSGSVVNQSTTNWVTVGNRYMEIPATINRPRRPFIVAACPVFGTGTAGTSIGAWVRAQLIIQNSNGTWPTTWTTIAVYTQDSTSVGSAAPIASGTTSTGTRGFRVRIQFRAVVANQGTQTNGWTGLFQALPAGTGVTFVDDTTGATAGGGTSPASPNDPVFVPPEGGWTIIP